MQISNKVFAEKCQKDLIVFLKFTSEICGCRNLKILIQKIYLLLPEFLGFESASLLLLNQESKELYSIPISKDDSSSDISSIIRFPQSLGISGTVIESGEIFYTNSGSTAKGKFDFIISTNSH
jgi:hypothetical protein